MPKPEFNQVSDDVLKRFYPKLATRILAHLRVRHYENNKALFTDLVKSFKKSDSRISQALKELKESKLIEFEKRKYKK